MIKLKHILLEQIETDSDIKMDVPADKTGTIISGLSSTDPWEYYFHDADKRWKTKRKTASKLLDMQTKLVRVYGEDKGASRYAQATSLLDKYIQNPNKAALDNKKVVDTVIPDNKVEVIPIISIDYTNQKVKEVWFSVNGLRHPIVDVLGKSSDDIYLEIKNPRKLHLNDIVYVNASSFTLSADNTTAEYNGSEGKRYDIFKIK